MTKCELNNALEQHKKWLASEGGAKANLRGANLSGADLSGANLSWADLSEANLRWANLSGANLRGANLYGADLSGANLSWANLSWADLSEANLRWADLNGADLDFACWPLWCGSSAVKIDERIARQLFSHVLSVAAEWIKPNPEQIEFANGFHRIVSGEFPRIEDRRRK